MTDHNHKTNPDNLPNEHIVSMTQVGVYTPRDAGGNFLKDKSIKIYAFSSDLQEALLMPKSDKGTHGDLAALLCTKYKEYAKATEVGHE